MVAAAAEAKVREHDVGEVGGSQERVAERRAEGKEASAEARRAPDERRKLAAEGEQESEQHAAVDDTEAASGSVQVAILGDEAALA